jgi:hypothetical protein
VNIAITGETHTDPAQPQYDLSDWLVIVLAIGCFVLCWLYVFLHPSPEVFGIGVGATVTNGSLFHMIRVHDDKRPDAK